MKILNHKYIKSILTLVLVMFIGSKANAQANTILGEDSTTVVAISLLLLVLILVLIITIYLLQTISKMVTDQAKEKGTNLSAEPSMWSNFWNSINGLIPMEKESSIELDHNYDGIRELDNHLPPWWKWMFYISIVFAVVYMLAYHVFETMPLQAEEYETEMANAATLQASTVSTVTSIDESNITFSEDPEVLASGKKVYDMNCTACHKAAGEGGIGPNLADEYWLHGSSAGEVYNSIKNGIPDKGMIAWKDVLSPSKINDVNSYIYTMRGTNPANAKEPQGVK